MVAPYIRFGIGSIEDIDLLNFLSLMILVKNGSG